MLQPPSTMTRFRLFWEAMDAVQAKRGLPPLGYEAARNLFECEIEPEALGETKREPLEDHYFEERLMRRDAR